MCANWGKWGVCACCADYSIYSLLAGVFLLRVATCRGLAIKNVDTGGAEATRVDVAWLMFFGALTK